MTSKHDKISQRLENRIGQNFDVILRNHEYFNPFRHNDYDVMGEIDRYMEKDVVIHGKTKTYAYLFETKCNDHEHARFKAYNQLHRARKNFEPCLDADVVFMYYVTSQFVRCIGFRQK